MDWDFCSELLLGFNFSASVKNHGGSLRVSRIDAKESNEYNEPSALETSANHAGIKARNLEFIPRSHTQ